MNMSKYLLNSSVLILKKTHGRTKQFPILDY